MIKAGHYNHVNPDITAENFPVSEEDRVKLNSVLVHFNQTITSEEAIEKFQKMRLRPATLPELLVFGVKYFEEQYNFQIIALGSVWRGSHIRRRVPYLNGWLDRRVLGLAWAGFGWDVGCRFLAVRA